ncbi:MAG: hypothetical protein HY421_01330 [Candidatus Kerfeldbacteria bacterium]|nr:hypothetical protein [Candidatus Kerfeldbacteria bacterium]
MKKLLLVVSLGLACLTQSSCFFHGYYIVKGVRNTGYTHHVVKRTEVLVEHGTYLVPSSDPGTAYLVAFTGRRVAHAETLGVFSRMDGYFLGNIEGYRYQVPIPFYGLNNRYPLVPVGFTNRTASTLEVYLFHPRQHRTMLGRFPVPACGEQVALVPGGHIDGVDIRWTKSGGRNPATIIPGPEGTTMISPYGWGVKTWRELDLQGWPRCSGVIYNGVMQPAYTDVRR